MEVRATFVRGVERERKVRKKRKERVKGRDVTDSRDEERVSSEFRDTMPFFPLLLLSPPFPPLHPSYSQ